MNPTLHRLAVFATLLTLFVIVLGAYVRLSHAGLGCPDWPGCYGKLTWPVAAHEIEQANQSFPDRPVERDKAWKEMAHRYAAGILVLLVAGINLLAWRSRHARGNVRLLAGALMALILFQAALGMWTVTLKLKPIIVMAHLMGGMATFALLIWLALETRRPRHDRRGSALTRYRSWIGAGIVLLAVQIALGGWTSANYAALACPDFPTCHGVYLPEADFVEGFRLWREVGVDYEGGVLDLRARVAIQVVHRVGAVVILLFLGLLAIALMRRPESRTGGAVLLALLLTQVTLGILNVVLYLPLGNATAHNGVAALLLAQLVWLLHRSGSASRAWR